MKDEAEQDFIDWWKSEAHEWLVKFGLVSSYGIEIDADIELGDLWGIIDQMDAEMRGWA